MHWPRAWHDCPAQTENCVTAERLVSYRRYPMRVAQDSATAEVVIAQALGAPRANPRPWVSPIPDCRAMSGPIDDHAAAIGAATRAWKENPDLVEVTVEGERGRPIWVVSPAGTFSQRS